MEGVTVARLRVDCVVPRNHPNPLAVRSRIDEAGERLPAALGAILEPLARAGDEVIVIQKLELTFDLDTSLQPSDLARAWAARLAAAVAHALRPESRITMLRFPDEAHYLARFLADSVTRRTTNVWYYRRWHGLDALPLAAQLRTAIVEDPRRGIAALATLTRSELGAVLAALGPREARRIIETAIATGSADDAEAPARSLAIVVPEWFSHATSFSSAWQAALALVARAAAAVSPVELPALVALAAAVAAIARRELSLAVSPSPAAMLDGAGLPSPAPLLALTATTRRELLATVGAPSTISPATQASWYTRLGGLLLLLPRIAELPLDELFGSDAGIARLVVLSRAAGHARRDEVLADPLWRRLCGVSLDADIDAWLAAPHVARELATAIWRRGAGRARSLELTVTRHVRPFVIVASKPDGDWVSATPLTPALRHAIRESSTVDVDELELEAHINITTARTAAHTAAWLGADIESPWALAAQHVLRAFARRLPGFAESSPQFLYDNFLDFDATILDGDDTFHCRVGRPRLAALFGLTGALRGRISIGNGRTVELYPEG